MTIIHSSDLGWAAGQDISDEFSAVVNTLKPGDVFVFDHMYKISATDIQLPKNITLAGGSPGAGLDVLGTKAHDRPLIEIGDSSTLVDLTVTHSDTKRGEAEGNNGATINAEGNNIQILNCSFEGFPKEFVRADGDSLSVVDTVFDGAYYQMRWHGEATNFSVENSLFHNSEGDGIKTARDGSGSGTQNATVSNSVFLNNGRDGIDTTGGFKDSSVIDSYFVGNGVSGMDLKTPIWKPDDLSPVLMVRNVTISGSEFIDTNKGLVLTTNDRAELLNDENFFDWAVQDVFISDTIFENTGSNNNVMVLAKGATGVYADDVTLLGRFTVYKEDKPFTLDHLKIDVNTNLKIGKETYGDPRPKKSDGFYESMAGPDWADITYPTDGVQPPSGPDVEPDPIPYEPEEPAAEDPVVQDPVAEEPVEVLAPETDLEPDATWQAPDSELLDIQLVDTGTDKVLFDLRDGAKLSSSDLAGRNNITLSAEAIGSSSADVGSVRLELDGRFSRVESAEPYALFGDKNGDFLGGTQLSDGTHSLTLTAYSGKGGNGSVLEQVTLSFEVGDYDSMLVDGNLSSVSSYSAIQDTGTATVSNDQSTVALEGSAWKSLDLFGDITQDTVLEFDFKSDVEGEIQGVGFINEDGDLKSAFFQLDGTQELGIQDFDEMYETGSGFKYYSIPVGDFFTGSADQLVLVSDDDADLGATSTFSNISLIEAFI